MSRNKKLVDGTEELIGTEVPEISKENVGVGTMATKPRKYGVVRYLQLYPQNKYVEAAMLAKYQGQVYTIEDWEKIVAKEKKILGVKD